MKRHTKCQENRDSTWIMSEKELEDELNSFRDILLHYDFSEVENIIFFDVESLNYYLQTNKENPFERQYQALEEKLNHLAPFIPTNATEETIKVLTEILSVKYDDKKIIKENILFNIKMDFIERVKNLKSENDWSYLVAICKKIRSEKEKLYQENKGVEMHEILE